MFSFEREQPCSLSPLGSTRELAYFVACPFFFFFHALLLAFFLRSFSCPQTRQQYLHWVDHWIRSTSRLERERKEGSGGSGRRIIVRVGLNFLLFVLMKNSTSKEKNRVNRRRMRFRNVVSSCTFTRAFKSFN